MNACKLIEDYQDVKDIREEELDNYKYLLPVEDESSPFYKTNQMIIEDLYNEVADKETSYKKDNHIYESLYEFSHQKNKQPGELHQPPLPDRRHSQNIKKQSRKNNNNAPSGINGDAKYRVPLGDCSNWTLSSTCGEMFFDSYEISNNCKIQKPNRNEQNVDAKEDDNNNNTLLSRLRGKNKQNEAQRKLTPPKNSPSDCNINPQQAVKHAPKHKTCKNGLQLGKYCSVFSQHKQFTKNLEEDNPNLNPIRSTVLRTEKMCKKDKDNNINCKISKLYDF